MQDLFIGPIEVARRLLISVGAPAHERSLTTYSAATPGPLPSTGGSVATALRVCHIKASAPGIGSMNGSAGRRTPSP